MSYSHPAYTRYPGLKDKTKPKKSSWSKVFAWTPKKTITKKTVWLRFVYCRHITIEWMPPSFPAGPYSNFQYATWEEILELTMR